MGKKKYLAGRQRWFLDGGLAHGSTKTGTKEAVRSGDGRGAVELSGEKQKGGSTFFIHSQEWSVSLYLHVTHTFV